MYYYYFSIKKSIGGLIGIMLKNRGIAPPTSNKIKCNYNFILFPTKTVIDASPKNPSLQPFSALRWWRAAPQLSCRSCPSLSSLSTSRSSWPSDLISKCSPCQRRRRSAFECSLVHRSRSLSLLTCILGRTRGRTGDRARTWTL